ncbi:hypothetical protein [Knoellia sp. p5-6-4]|uniref:hypothetical protein n=1 Tax=unclassified Knoellia TaxID=2618719 RepID=UPI0023DB26B0|nr:hypothetical protein [Knoellia sp. p5-6-4]MDF2146076.1 hypothetical protein [Knoellia sp. p5-6-4]
MHDPVAHQGSGGVPCEQSQVGPVCRRQPARPRVGAVGEALEGQQCGGVGAEIVGANTARPSFRTSRPAYAPVKPLVTGGSATATMPPASAARRSRTACGRSQWAGRAAVRR